MAVIVEGGRLTLTGYVGEASWEFDGVVVFDGFTHPEVVAALAEIGDDANLVVHINSGGGYAREGAAIRTALGRRKGRTDVVVDGIAASAASLIAMAGETISMALGTQMMIHDPAGLTLGTVEDHQATIRGLDSLGGTYASVYAARSGKTKDECRDIMRAETWFEPEEAVAAGFADIVLGNKGQPIAAFPYQAYAHAPRPLVALASEQAWRRPPPQIAASAVKPAARPAAPTSRMEEPMADKTPAGQDTADHDAIRRDAATAAVKTDRERRAAIMALLEAKGREELASHLHASTEMTVEQVKAALAVSPEAKADAPAPAAAAEPATDPKAYEASRLTGAGLGGVPKVSAKSDRAPLAAAVTSVNKRR